MKVIVPVGIALCFASFFVPYLGVFVFFASLFVAVIALIALVRGWLFWAGIESRPGAFLALLIAAAMFVCGASGAVVQHPAVDDPSVSVPSETLTPEPEPPAPAPEPAAPAPAPEPAAPPEPAPAPEPAPVDPSKPAPAPVVSFKNCTEARNAGAAPIHRGSPGYGEHLDRDGDGVGCDK